MIVVGIDPGGSTGLAVLRDDKITGFVQLQPEHHQELYEWLDSVYPNVIVCESFHYRRKLDNVNLTPVEYIGVVKLWCEHRSKQLVLQNPSTGKGFWSDDKLKAIGLYRGGMPHAMDALRHLLHYLTFTKHQSQWLDQLQP